MASLLNSKRMYKENTIPTKRTLKNCSASGPVPDRDMQAARDATLRAPKLRTDDPLSYDSRRTSLFRKSFGKKLGGLESQSIGDRLPSVLQEEPRAQS